MGRWEYATLLIQYDDKKGWFVKYADGEVVGLDKNLNEFGEDGWELVNLIPEVVSTWTLPYPVQTNIKSFRAIFKRQATT